jgi:hypothetical protein
MTAPTNYEIRAGYSSACNTANHEHCIGCRCGCHETGLGGGGLLVQDEFTNLPCDCGRGPILEGNGTPDVCAACYEEAPVDECDGHPAGPNDPMGVTVYCDGSCR